MSSTFCPVAGGFLLQVAAAAKVKQNSTGDAQLPVKTQKILDEKNDLILKMREEIQANNCLLFWIIFFFLFAGDEDDNKRSYRRRVLVSVGSCSQEKHLDGGSGDSSSSSDKQQHSQIQRILLEQR